MKTEQPYLDKNGIEIKEWALLKVFHFSGGRGNKKHYMYKLVRLREASNGSGGKERYWYGLHITKNFGEGYFLRATANEQRVIANAEIVQYYN